MQKQKLLYFFYNRLQDPLLQSNIFLYINALAKENIYDVAIVTYEDKNFPLSKEEINSIKQKFSSQGISWHPLKWHSGSHLLLKLVDFISGYFKIVYLSKIKGYRNVISLGSIAGSFIYLFSRAIKINYYLYQYEPHSEYALDNAIWKANSLQFKLLNKWEKKSVQNCKVVSSGTNFMQDRLKDLGVKAEFFKITSVANTDVFVFSDIKRKAFRQKYGINDSKKLVIYPGKTGGLYFDSNTLLNTFKVLWRIDASFHFLVISPNIIEIKTILEKEDPLLQTSVTLLLPINYEDMPSALSAADIGLVAVAPGPSKKFISNIKVGEYLCCGLPYLICKGISEDDIVAKKYNVGVVVENFSDSEIVKSYAKIKEILGESKIVIAERCRKTGIEYRGFENQFKNYKEALDRLTVK